MSDWLALQQDIAAALADPSLAPGAERHIAGAPQQARGRLGIYRANVAAAAAKALANAYPVVLQVVGEEFFQGLANAYRRACPSRSGDLTEFGARFADFLADFAPARRLPYLADLARLEWAVQAAYGAADADPWDAAEFETVPADHQADLRFRWAPGCALVPTDCPVVQIWSAHQDEPRGTFAIDWERADIAFVSRAGFQVEVEALHPGDAAFISASLRQVTLGDAITDAMLAEPAFDLAKLLSRLIRSNLIVGFDLEPSHEALQGLSP